MATLLPDGTGLPGGTEIVAEDELSVTLRLPSGQTLRMPRSTAPGTSQLEEAAIAPVVTPIAQIAPPEEPPAPEDFYAAPQPVQATVAEPEPSAAAPTQEIAPPPQPQFTGDIVADAAPALQRAGQQQQIAAQAVEASGLVAEQAAEQAAAERDEVRDQEQDLLQKQSVERQLDQADLNRFQAQRDALYEEARSKEVDPRRFMKDSNKGQMVLAIILGGLGAALTGRDNPVIAQLNHMVEQDIAAQEQEIDRADARARSADNRVNQWRSIMQDNEVARAARRKELWEGFARAAESINQRGVGAQARIAGQKQAADLRAKAEEASIKFAGTVAEQRRLERKDVRQAGLQREQLRQGERRLDLTEREIAIDQQKMQLRHQQAEKEALAELGKEERERTIVDGITGTPLGLAVSEKRATKLQDELRKKTTAIEKLGFVRRATADFMSKRKSGFVLPDEENWDSETREYIGTVRTVMSQIRKELSGTALTEHEERYIKIFTEPARMRSALAGGSFENILAQGMRINALEADAIAKEAQLSVPNGGRYFRDLVEQRVTAKKRPPDSGVAGALAPVGTSMFDDSDPPIDAGTVNVLRQFQGRPKLHPSEVTDSGRVKTTEEKQIDSRKSSVESLSEEVISGRRTIDSLEQVAEKSPVKEVRQLAKQRVLELKSIGNRKELPELEGVDRVDSTLSQLKPFGTGGKGGSGKRVKTADVFAFARLQKTAAEAKDKALRKRAFDAIATLRKAGAFGPLNKALQSTTRKLRAAQPRRRR